MNKRRLVYAVACFLLACSLVGCSGSELSSTDRGIKSGPSTLATSSISAPAELVSLQDISLTPPNVTRMWEYKIEFLARENSIVSEGDVIIRFDGQQLRTNLVSRQGELNAAMKEAEQKALEEEARLEQLELDLAEAIKNRDIAQRKVEITDVSRSEIERRKQQAEFAITSEKLAQAKQRKAQHQTAMQVNAKVQQAKISKARSRVKEIEDSIIKLEVKAPKDGMVVLIPNGDDDKPAIGDTVFMGARLVSLPALDKIAVKVEFDESHTPLIDLGDSVQVTLDAFPERPFNGEITDIGKTYRNKSRNNLKVVFDAWVTLDELDFEIMRPGMKATVDLIEEG